MTSALVVSVLVAASGGHPFKLAAIGLNSSPESLQPANFILEVAASAIQATGRVDVVTPSQISALLGQERQRQLVGCTDAACTAELSGALNADGLLIGTYARSTSRVSLELKAVSARTGQSLATFSVQAANDDALADAVREASPAFSSRLLGRAATPPEPFPAAESVARSSVNLRRLAWIPFVAGGLAAAGAGALLYESRQEAAKLTDGTTTLANRDEVLQTADRGRREQTAAMATSAVALAAVLTGIVFLTVDGDTGFTGTVAAIPTAAGGAFAVGGTF